MVADLYREQLQMAGVAAENGDHLLPLLLQLVQGTDSCVVPQTSSISIPSEPLKCKPQDPRPMQSDTVVGRGPEICISQAFQVILMHADV